jgi:bifunctional N-acetylglucosamine-1-phosphate-uridyltransferase/glucosamine-1-phosphate-acetyltransferase GlmU-like protein
MKIQKPLKAVILAAGNKSITEDGLPVLLQDLGGKKIIDYVIANAGQVVSPAETYIIVGYHQEAIREHLGPGYNYVTQGAPHGTGEAVLALRPLLKEFEGDLLILYGDTPLFNPTSIRGLINRHLLRGANLTILTAVSDHYFPYGRVIRDMDGRIMDVIEEDQASVKVKEIHELNVGGYVVSAREIWPALEALTPSPLDGEYRLTSSVHQLIHRGLQVESYQIYDQDEIQGINTRLDLERAELILKRRYYRPRREEERPPRCFLATTSIPSCSRRTARLL